MDRRHVLGAIATAGSTIVGGCSRFATPKSLGAPTVDHPEEGEWYYDLVDEGEHIGNIDVNVRPRDTPRAATRLIISAGPQADGWQASTLRFGLRAPADGGRPLARILLDVDDIAGYPVSVQRTADDYRVVALDGLAADGLGGSTIPLRFEVIPRTPVETLAFRATTRWRAPSGRSVVSTVNDRLSMPVS